MMTFEITTTSEGQYAVYERLADGRRWNCRGVFGTESEADEWSARFAETERRIDAMLAAAPPVDPNLPHCWECGTPIQRGHGVLDSGVWAHRSCVGG